MLLIEISATVKDLKKRFYSSLVLGENTVNGDQSDAHMSTLSQSSKEVSVVGYVKDLV